MSPRLQVDVITLFPSFFASPLEQSLMKKAREKGRVRVRIHDLREYTHDRHRTVDDKPFGGGPGMILKPEPIFECVEAVRGLRGPRRCRAWVVSLDPQGRPLTQKTVRRLARRRHLILIAGHYEGVDQRVRDRLVDEEISVGDFVTMGGEAPALCLLEAVVRLVPGVLGNRDSLKNESFEGPLLEYPQYTRPRVFRKMEVPSVLVSGHHGEVARWRKKMAHRVTRRKRRDLVRGIQ